MTQSDLFGAPALTPRPSVPLPRHATSAPTPPPLFPVPDHWMHRLARAGYPDPVIVVSALYTELVLESLCLPDAQFILFRDGRVTEAPPADWPIRRRLMTAAEALMLHRERPLVVIGTPILRTMHLRLARDGDIVLTDLPLPGLL